MRRKGPQAESRDIELQTVAEMQAQIKALQLRLQATQVGRSGEVVGEADRAVSPSPTRPTFQGAAHDVMRQQTVADTLTGSLEERRAIVRAKTRNMSRAEREEFADRLESQGHEQTLARSAVSGPVRAWDKGEVPFGEDVKAFAKGATRGFFHKVGSAVYSVGKTIGYGIRAVGEAVGGLAVGAVGFVAGAVSYALPDSWGAETVHNFSRDCRDTGAFLLKDSLRCVGKTVKSALEVPFRLAGAALMPFTQIAHQVAEHYADRTDRDSLSGWKRDKDLEVADYLSKGGFLSKVLAVPFHLAGAEPFSQVTHGDKKILELAAQDRKGSPFGDWTPARPVYRSGVFKWAFGKGAPEVGDDGRSDDGRSDDGRSDDGRSDDGRSESEASLQRAEAGPRSTASHRGAAHPRFQRQGAEVIGHGHCDTGLTGEPVRPVAPVPYPQQRSSHDAGRLQANAQSVMLANSVLGSFGAPPMVASFRPEDDHRHRGGARDAGRHTVAQQRDMGASSQSSGSSVQGLAEVDSPPPPRPTAVDVGAPACRTLEVAVDPPQLQEAAGRHGLSPRRGQGGFTAGVRPPAATLAEGVAGSRANGATVLGAPM